MSVSAYLLLCSPLLAVETPMHSISTADVTLTQDAVGTTGFDTSSLVSEGLHTATLLNVTPFDGAATINIPLFDYDSVNVSFVAEPINETATVTFYIELGGFQASSEQLLVRGQRTRIVLEAPLQKAQNWSNSFAWWMNIWEGDPEQLAFSSLTVTAMSSEALWPVTVDARGLDGDSIFSSPIMQEAFITPTLFLHREGTNQSEGFLIPTHPNETYYLRLGNLTGRAELTEWGYDVGYDLHKQAFAIALNVTSGHSLHCNLRLPYVPMTVNMIPVPPVFKIAIFSDWWYNSHCFIAYFSSDPAILQEMRVPVGSKLSVRIDPVKLTPANLQTPYIQTSSYPGSASVTFNATGASAIQVHVHLGYYGMLGILIIPADILVFAPGLVLYAAVVVEILFQTKLVSEEKRIRWHDPRLLSLFLLIIASLFPWYSCSFTNRSGVPWGSNIHVNLAAFGPFPILMYGTEGSGVCPVVSADWLGWSFAAIVLVWFPLGVAALRLGAVRPRSPDWLAGLFLVLPALFAIGQSYSTSSALGTGIQLEPVVYVLFLVPLVWFIITGLIRLGEATRSGYYEGLVSWMERPGPGGQSQSVPSEAEIASGRKQMGTEAVPTMPNANCASIIIAALILLLPSAEGVPTSGLWPFVFPYLLAGPFSPYYDLTYVYAWYRFYAEGFDLCLALHAWLLIAIPYAVLALFALLRARAFIKGAETRLNLAFYLVLPILASAASAAYLNWLSATYDYYKTTWYPLPVAPALIGIMALQLRRRFKQMHGQ